MTIATHTWHETSSLSSLSIIFIDFFCRVFCGVRSVVPRFVYIEAVSILLFIFVKLVWETIYRSSSENCWYCGEPGHIKIDCPSRSVSRCAKCHKVGHDVGQCDNRKRGRDKSLEKRGKATVSHFVVQVCVVAVVLMHQLLFVSLLYLVRRMRWNWAQGQQMSPNRRRRIGVVACCVTWWGFFERDPAAIPSRAGAWQV